MQSERTGIPSREVRRNTHFTWTPNWTVGELVPGSDVVWLETPFPSLPADQASVLDQTTIAGIPGCANDPCQTGWPPNDIRAVANSNFLDANPPVRALLEQVVVPLADISAQNVRMVTEGGDPADIRRHAEEWVAANAALVNRWISAADPMRSGWATLRATRTQPEAPSAWQRGPCRLS